MPRDALQAIEHKLHTAQAIIASAARDAETLRDQGLADDLHALNGDLVMRLLPAVRRGVTPPALVS